jgi:hypothetical protein
VSEEMESGKEMEDGTRGYKYLMGEPFNKCTRQQQHHNSNEREKKNDEKENLLPAPCPKLLLLLPHSAHNIFCFICTEREGEKKKGIFMSMHSSYFTVDRLSFIMDFDDRYSFLSHLFL